MAMKKTNDYKINKTLAKEQLECLYKHYIENVYGPAGKRKIGIDEIIRLVEDPNSRFHIETPAKGDEFSVRVAEYLRRYPYKIFIYKHYPDVLQEMAEKGNGVSVLEVGSFLGNEVRGIERYLENHGITEYTVAGVEIEPFHLLIGFLLHNDVLEDHNFYVCDACDMSGIFLDNSFDYVYSEGLLHALSKEEDKVIQLKETRRVLRSGGLLFGSTLSSRDLPSKEVLEQVKIAKVLYSSKDELYGILKKAGFEDVVVEEIKRNHPVRDAIKYELVFYAR
jgi:ubiquinone/menaquinone biosynthesis C-methylase UbiE